MISQIEPDYFIYFGAFGILIGFIFLLLFFYRRFCWIISIFSRQKSESPKLISSLRNLILIITWTSLFGLFLFFGFFLRAFYTFTMEKPVAEIITQPLDVENQTQVTLVQFVSSDSQRMSQYIIKGDQWVLEGDILKWDNWLNFLGLHTRYRLTRIRGRFLKTETEIQELPTIFSLCEDENHPIWQYLYKYGHKLPLVSTVYGNAAFQLSNKANKYLVYVSTSGFLIREKIN